MIHSLLLTISTFQQVPIKPVADINPLVHKELQEITRSFREVKAISIDTTYEANHKFFLPIQSMKLIYQRPNRLSLEIKKPSASADKQEPDVTQVVCNGKELFTYQQVQGFYSKEKAPKDTKELQLFIASIEMAAITGLEPFEALEKTARSTSLASGPDVDAVSTNEITFDVSDNMRKATIKIYAGKQDHLIRKLAFDAKPIPQPKPDKKIEDPNEPPPPEAQEERPVSVSYENHIESKGGFPKEVFAWSPPKGVFEYQGMFTGINMPNTGKGKNKKSNDTLPNGMPAMKIYSIQELMKRAKNN